MQSYGKAALRQLLSRSLHAFSASLACPTPLKAKYLDKMSASRCINPTFVARRVQTMPTPHRPPAAVRRTLRKLGSDIHDARRRRKLPMAVVAERAFTSRSTLQK